MDFAVLLQVQASLFAGGCFCELADDFALVFLQMLVNLMSSSDTSSTVRLAGARVFPKMNCSCSIADGAYKVQQFLYACLREMNWQEKISFIFGTIGLVLFVPRHEKNVNRDSSVDVVAKVDLASHISCVTLTFLLKIIPELKNYVVLAQNPLIEIKSRVKVCLVHVLWVNASPLYFIRA